MIWATTLLSLVLTSNIVNPTDSYPSHLGPTGTPYTISAVPLEPTTFGAGLFSNFFSEDNFIDGNKQSRNQFRISGHYTHWQNLEFFTGTTFSFSDNSTAAGARSATTFFENTDLGVKYIYPVLKKNTESESKYWGWNVGAYASSRFFSGGRTNRNTSGVTTSKSGPIVTGLGGIISTLDFKDMWKKFPFRHHFNLGVRGANGDIQGLNRQLDRFSLDSYDYTAFTYATSVELIYHWVSPFIEYSGELSITAPTADNVSFSDNRSKLTLGVRGRPMSSVGIHVGANLGFGGPGTTGAVGIPRNTPVEFIAGITFEAVGRKLQDTEGSLKGVITDEATGMPLSEVEVTLIGQVTRPTRTDLSGYYELYDLQNGNYEVKFEKLDYSPTTRRFVISGGDEDLDVALKSTIPTKGDVNLTIKDEETGEAIKNAAVRVKKQSFATNTDGEISVKELPAGPNTFQIEAKDYQPLDVPLEVIAGETINDTIILRKITPDTGTCGGIVKNENGTPLTAVITSVDRASEIRPFGTDPLTGEFNQPLAPGTYRFKIQAENYLPQEVDCEVGSGESKVVNIVLEKPEKAIVIENKVILPDAIFFEFDSAKVKEESFSTLDQVVEVLSEEESFDLLKVEGHTDNVGSDSYNLELSKRRAESVRNYLIKKGLPANKIEASGFGESKAIATNLSEDGRAENRRVEFNLIRRSGDE